MESDHFYKLFTNPDLLNDESADELKILLKEFPCFQLGWILYLKNLKQIGSKEFNNVLKKVALKVSNRKLLHRFLNGEKEIVAGNPDGKKVSTGYFIGDGSNIEKGTSLIDKFLSAETGIKVRGNSNEEPDSNAYVKEVVERSVIENDEIFTEKLAELLFQQKNYEKAMEAYKKLSLKFPEKSVYFATRIKEIEQIKNI